MRANSKPWTNARPRRHLRGIAGGLQCKSKRTLDLLDVAFGAYLFDCEEDGVEPDARPKWFCEVGTSAEREPWGSGLATVSTKARMYYYLQDQLLAAAQLAFVHGFPKEATYDNIEEHLARRLLGNSVYLPHMTIAVIAAWVNEAAPWHGPEYRVSALSPQSVATPSSSAGMGTPGAGPPKKKRRRQML